MHQIGVTDMKITEQTAAAKKFAEMWENRGYEKGKSQSFWLFHM